jgi:hypothetical protein
LADVLTITLALNNSFVASGVPVVVTATLTDESTTPRTWNLSAGSVMPPQGAAMNGGDFLLSASRTVVPAGGSLVLTASVVFYLQQQGNEDPIQQTYAIDAEFLTDDGQSAGNDESVYATVGSSIAVPIATPLAAQLDYRSNLRSQYAQLLLEY